MTRGYRVTHHVARIADDLTNHVRLREDARGNRAVRRRQFQQAHFGRPERRRRIALQRRLHAEICATSAGRVDPNLSRNPNRDRVSRFGERFTDRNQPLETAVVVRDPFRRQSRRPFGTLMGSSGTSVSSVKSPCRNAARYTIGFIADPGCRIDRLTRLKSLYDVLRPLIDLAAAGLGQHAPVAVPQARRPSPGQPRWRPGVAARSAPGRAPTASFTMRCTRASTVDVT